MSENRKRYEEIKEILKRDSTMHFLEIVEIEELFLEQNALLDKIVEEERKNARLKWRV